MSDAKDTEIMSQYEAYSVEELKEALKAIFLFSELNDADIEEMDQIMAVLRKKAPFYNPHTTEEMWAEFQADYAEELANIGIRKNEDTEEVVNEASAVDLDVERSGRAVAPERPKRHRNLLRVGLVAAAIVGLMVAVTVTASALGYNLWGWIPKWNDEVISFHEESGEETNRFETSLIVLTLSKLGIDEPLYPTWLPDGFELESSVIETDPLLLYEAYLNGERYLSITIQPISAAQDNVYQKEDSPPIEYYSNSNIHYIVYDIDQYTAIWQSDDYLVYIIGNITFDEITRIIDSVYEVEK